MTLTKVESIYGIYFGHSASGYVGPIGERQASCIIYENQSHQEIIDHLVASDFLDQFSTYQVIDWGPSIHIHYKEGGIALVLAYEGDYL